MVVPLQVVIGATVLRRGRRRRDAGPGRRGAPGVDAGQHVAAGPGGAAGGLREAAADGADEIVSIHLSGEMSGTFESAQLAARDALGAGAAGRHPAGRGRDRVRRARGAPTCSTPAARAEEAAAAARARAAASSSLFYVDTLEYLRRGGRIGAAAALLGGALAVKPLLKIEDGKVASLEQVRTSARALARLEELAVEAAGEAAGRRVRRAPGEPRAGRAARRPSWPSGWRTNLERARGAGAASSVPCSARTSGRAWSRSAWRPR